MNISPLSNHLVVAHEWISTTPRPCECLPVDSLGSSLRLASTWSVRKFSNSGPKRRGDSMRARFCGIGISSAMTTDPHNQAHPNVIPALLFDEKPRPMGRNNDIYGRGDASNVRSKDTSPATAAIDNKTRPGGKPESTKC